MATLSTKQGDGGQTRLVGGIRVSKSHLRVEAGGTLDELNSVMGFARSICQDAEICDRIKTIQRELFLLGTSLATPRGNNPPPSQITADKVEALTAQVNEIETLEGILFDWSLPGEHPVSAAFDMARTVCRRAERQIVRLTEVEGEIDPNIIPYLNRLSDLLWLVARWVELRAGVDTT